MQGQGISNNPGGGAYWKLGADGDQQTEEPNTLSLSEELPLEEPRHTSHFLLLPSMLNPR